MNQISFDDLFIDENKEINKHDTQSPLQNKVFNLIQSGKISAIEICGLIESGHISSQRYSTNKPKAYGQVCLILENLVLQGTLKFIEEKDHFQVQSVFSPTRIHWTNPQFTSI